MVHPLTISEMYIDSLKEGQGHEGALYPNGAHLTDLREIRDLVYKMQRPGIAPDVRPNFIHWIHPPRNYRLKEIFVIVGLSSPMASHFFCRKGSHTYFRLFREEKDLVLFNNRGLMHSVVGVFKEGQIRLFHQCNLAASDEPLGPSVADVEKWA